MKPAPVVQTQNIAAIDLGSNAIRLGIWAVNGSSTPKLVENIREPVRLGQDVFTKGLISEETIERTFEAFVRFRKLLYKYGVEQIRAVATSAVREATNRDDFLKRIAKTFDINIQVISWAEEARLIHLAVAEKINFEKKVALLVDIGGGSVEIMLVDNGQIAKTESFKMGTVRLLTRLGGKNERRFYQLVREYVDAAKKRIKKEIAGKKIDLYLGTGGNVESIGDLRNELFGKSNGAVTRDQLETIIQRLQAMSVEERIQKLGLRPDRADVIIPAAIVLQKVMKLAEVDELLIPHVGLKEGVLLDMVQQIQGDSKFYHRDQVMASALQLGRKYAFDEAHGVETAKLAVQLFDATRDLHHLNQESRLLLEVAALLHDIGHFVNVVGHHKHTYYLLTASPLIGLNDSQSAIVANVARYHRKAVPTTSHEAYQNLSPKDRMIVTKLSAILRLADALDIEHGARVQNLTALYKKPNLILKLKGEGDLLLEKWALMRQLKFFEEVFSVKVMVDE